MCKIMGFIPEEELVGNCATCKHYRPLIKEFHGIKTKFARGSCNVKEKSVYKGRTETCKKWIDRRQ